MNNYPTPGLSRRGKGDLDIILWSIFGQLFYYNGLGKEGLGVCESLVEGHNSDSYTARFTKLLYFAPIYALNLVG